MNDLLRLYPLPTEERTLHGAYLAHDLRQLAESRGEPYIYANFVASVDGRVAVQNEKGKMVVPKSVANDRDWRLFQELAAQADLILITTRYLKDWAAGRSGEIFQAENDDFADLVAWRQDQNLPPQSDMGAVSARLQAAIPAELLQSDRELLFITVESSPAHRRESLREAGHQVIVAGEKRVDGRLLKAQLAALGYQTVYLATGPTSMSFLLPSGGLDRLYLTMGNRLLGGQDFKSIVDGPSFSPAVDLHLNEVYLDQQAPAGQGQLLISYDSLSPENTPPPPDDDS